jgi:hypothetical protein
VYTQLCRNDDDYYELPYGTDLSDIDIDILLRKRMIFALCVGEETQPSRDDAICEFVTLISATWRHVSGKKGGIGDLMIGGK